MQKTPFGKTADGDAVELFTLRNAQGMVARIATYGGTVVSLEVPDRQGRTADVVLGFDALEGYLGPHPHFGGIIGRYANRIARGRFTLGGVEYVLARNNGENHLHGGTKGFDRVMWKDRDASTAAGPAVELSYLSKDGEEGYPGNLSTKVTYALTDESELRIDYEATTDKETVLNLTNHSYFNLAGSGAGDILGHVLVLDAPRFAPVRADLIPTGDVRPVEGTPSTSARPRPSGPASRPRTSRSSWPGGTTTTTFSTGRRGRCAGPRGWPTRARAGSWKS